jgi:hypothetical protein
VGDDPSDIHTAIEETRDRLEETVEAIGYKADVPARAGDAATSTARGALERFSAREMRRNRWIALGLILGGAAAILVRRTAKSGQGLQRHLVRRAMPQQHAATRDVSR